MNKGQCPVSDDNSSYHCIVPNNELVTLIPNDTEPEDQQIQTLNVYVNKPHIKHIVKNDLISGNKDDGGVILASITNNPRNFSL